MAKTKIMEDTKMNGIFKAIKFSSYEEDGVIVVAFADSLSPDPAIYLILSRLREESECYIEYANNGGFQGYNGISRIVLKEDEVRLIFEDKEEPPISEIIITTNKIDDSNGERRMLILEGFRNVFRSTDVTIQSQ